MTAPVGRWRATYTPGDWIVLAGPTSVVVLEPATNQWASLVPALWNEVLQSASLVDLASQLAGYRIDTMPSFAAFFWTEDGMRSLVRGGVQVLDPASGSIVASGEGIQTWSEVGLGELTKVRVELPDAHSDTSGPQMSLPLVVGAVRASGVLLDASDDARVFSPQAGADVQEKEDEDEAAARDGEAADAELDGPATELMSEPFPETDPELPAADDPDLATAAVPPPGPPPEASGPPPIDPRLLDSMEDGDTQLMMPPVAEAEHTPDFEGPGVTILAVICPYGHSSPPSATVCRICSNPIESQQPQLVARPPLALLRASDGSVVEVDRAVLLGRAPSANLSADPAPRLMTVPSPGHDISRTHAEVAPEDWQIVVTDLRSTNGTVLVRPGSGERRQLPPGESVPVPLQSLLELGDGVSVLIDFPQ